MRRSSGVVRAVGVVLVIGLILLVLKWALITAAILAVPFGVWWLFDRASARSRGRGVSG